jgi:malate dehydrogenase
MQVILLDIKGEALPKESVGYYQCATNTGFNTRVSGVTNDYTKTADSNVVVITSGIQENQGMTREELIGINAGIVKMVVNIDSFT